MIWAEWLALPHHANPGLSGIREPIEIIFIFGNKCPITEGGQISTGVSAAIEEQGAATREIARNVERAAQGTKEVSTNIEGVSENARKTGNAAEQVLQSATELASNSASLRGELTGFLSEIRAS